MGAKKITNYLPEKSTGPKKNIALRIAPDLFLAVEKKRKRDGLSWHDLFIAACKQYLDEGR